MKKHLASFIKLLTVAVSLAAFAIPAVSQAQTAPSLTITAPAANAVWTQGQTYTVSWKMNNSSAVPADATVLFVLSNKEASGANPPQAGTDSVYFHRADPSSSCVSPAADGHLASASCVNFTAGTAQITIPAITRPGEYYLDFQCNAETLSGNPCGLLDWSYLIVPVKVVAPSTNPQLWISQLPLTTSVRPGDNQATLARFSFDASASPADVNLYTFEMFTGQNDNLHLLSNCNLYTGQTILATSPNGLGNPSSEPIFYLNGSAGLTVKKGTSTEVDFRCDVSSQANGATYHWTLPSDSYGEVWATVNGAQSDFGSPGYTVLPAPQVTVSSASASLPPVISGLTAPTQLTVNQVGDWTIRASDPQNGALSYTINFGDNNVYGPLSTTTAMQSATFPHAYSTAGTYTVSATVTNSAGLIASTTATVTVTNVGGSGGGGSCYYFANNLGVGATGVDVVALQTWLISHGYHIPAVESGLQPKGYYGNQTGNAVLAYQASVRVSDPLVGGYGYFGDNTRVYLNTHCTISATTTPTITSITPNVIQSGVTTPVTLYGSNFNSSLMIAIVGSGADTSVSPSELNPNGTIMSFAFPSSISAPGTYTIQVYNYNKPIYSQTTLVVASSSTPVGGGGGGGGYSTCYTFSQNLSLGSTGTDVVALQTWLIANGYHIPAIESGAQPKGYYGNQTAAALTQYQNAAGISEQYGTLGYFGPVTRAALNANCGSTPPVPVTCPAGYVCTPPNTNNNSISFQAVFNKSFGLTSVPSSATLSLAADNQFIAYVNGNYVGTGSGGTYGDDNFSHVTTYNVAKYLHAGTNTLSITGENYATTFTSWPSNAMGLLYKLTDQNGNTITASDGSESIGSATIAGGSSVVLSHPHPSYVIIPGASWIWDSADPLYQTYLSYNGLQNPATSNSIKITSPSGTASWQQNTIATWTWSSSGSVSSVDIWLVNPNGGNDLAFAKAYPNYGSFQWNVGAASSGWNIPLLPDGNYTIAVCPAGVEVGPTCGQFNVNISGSDYVGGTYRIDSINPSTAAIGSTVTLTGANFDQYSVVSLVNANGGPESGADITPSSLTSTSLTFIVPSSNTSQTNPSTVGTNYVSIFANKGQGGGFRNSNSVTLNVTSANSQTTCPSGQTWNASWGSCTVQVQQSSGQPYVKVVSPDGGQTYSPGQAVPISFSTNLTSSQAPNGFNIWAYYGGNSTNVGSYASGVTNIAMNYTGGTTYNWTVPSSLSAGNYVIYIVPSTVVGVSNTGLFAFGDSYFTITAPAVQQQTPVTVSTPPASIAATVDGSSPLASTVQISTSAQTQSVPLLVFDLKSSGQPATLSVLNVNINASQSSLISQLKVRIGSQTYSAASFSSTHATFANFGTITLPADANVQMTVMADVAADTTGSLNGSTASVQVPMSGIIAMAGSPSPVPVSGGTLSGNTITFSSPSVAASNSSVTSPTASTPVQTSSITVSPLDSQSYSPSSPIHLGWTLSGSNTVGTFGLSLYTTTGGLVSSVYSSYTASFASGSGYVYNLSLPSSVSPGQYKIRITFTSSSGQVTTADSQPFYVGSGDSAYLQNSSLTASIWDAIRAYYGQ